MGIVDLKIGVEIHFLLLYLIPIALGSWYVNREAGVYLAMFCSLIWVVAESLGGHHHSSPWIAYWNFGMRTGTFIVFALIQSQLRVKFDALSDLARRDFLTGLPNARAFYEIAADEMTRMRRAFDLDPMTLACIDIEGFEWINQRFGYATGDQMLCMIAQVLRESVSRPDLIGRIGGTAFAVLLPKTDSEGASFVLESIQKELTEERRKYSQPVTFFISAIACTKVPRSVAELMHEAESQLTRMKGGTRDVIQITNVESEHALN